MTGADEQVVPSGPGCHGTRRRSDSPPTSTASGAEGEEGQGEWVSQLGRQKGRQAKAPRSGRQYHPIRRPGPIRPLGAEAVEVGGLSLRRRVPWQPGPDGTTCSPRARQDCTLLVPCPRLRVFFFFFWFRSTPAARPATTRGRGPRRSPGPTAATRPRTWATSRARARRMVTRTRTGGPDQDLPRRKTSRLRPGGELPSTPALPSPSVLTVFIALFLRTPSHASAAAGA